MAYRIEIQSDNEDRVIWQAHFANEAGKDDNAETERVIGVVKELANALQALKPVTSESE